MDDEVYHKIGDKCVGDVAVFELVLGDHVTMVNPADFGMAHRDVVNPAEYFITSGDAVEKARVLNDDMWAMAGGLRRELLQLIASENNCDVVKAQTLIRAGVRPKHPSGLYDFEVAIWKCAGQCRRLLNALIIAKGVNSFLETEYDSEHRLLCLPKNPRNK